MLPQPTVTTNGSKLPNGNTLSKSQYRKKKIIIITFKLIEMTEQNEKRQNSLTAGFLSILAAILWLIGKFVGETNWYAKLDTIGIIMLLIPITLLTNGLWILFKKRK